MKHARPDYSRIQDPSDKIPADEPVFLIRGQDEVAATTVRIWAQLNNLVGGDPELSNMAMDQADLMDNWSIKKKADYNG